MIERFPVPIILLTLTMTGISVFHFKKINSDLIETDLSKLRNINSMKSGSIYWGRFQDQVFDRYLSPIVILPKDRGSAKRIVSEVKKIKDSEGQDSFISSVSTIDDFVPEDQPLQIETLRQIRSTLKPPMLSELNPEQRKLTETLLAPESQHPFNFMDLPEIIRFKFQEKSGAVGNLILIEPTLNPRLSQIKNLNHFVNSIRNAADKVMPGVAVAGTLPVTSDLFESILRDAPKAILFAWLTVFLLVAVIFRDFITILLCSAGLILGVLWLAGFIFIFKQKINFLNFIVLPITFGIGVDYGINVFQRYRSDHHQNILNVIRQTGGAVMLASLTTMIGYGSLILASNQAFVSFGRLAIIGEITCVFAAVISLPSFLWYIERRNRPELRE
jgi:predicted RND superfamily exporter protein